MKGIALLLLVLVSAFSGQAQDWVTVWQNDNTSFSQKQAAWESYFAGKDLSSIRGWKAFKRWEYYYQRRMANGEDHNTVKEKTLAHFLDTNTEGLSTNTPVSTNGAWTYIGPTGLSQGGGAGRINFTTLHPNGDIYVGAPSGGLWRRNGTNWSSNTDQLSFIGFSDLIVNAANPQIMLAATGDADAGDAPCIGVLKSINGGATWSSSGLTSMTRIHKLLYEPNNFNKVFAATNTGIWMTTNAGSSWSSVYGGGRVYDIEFKPGDPTVVYAVTALGYVKSTDGGLSFSTPSASSSLPASGTNRRAIAVTPANPDYLYMVCGRSDNSGLHSFWRSTDGGNTFTMMLDGVGGALNLLGWNPSGNDAGGQSWYDLAIAASPLNADVVMVGGVNVWRTTNGGSNWTLFGHWYGGGGAPYCHADIHNLAFAGNGDLYASTDGGLFRATNVTGGANFTDLSSGLHIAQIYRLGVSQTNSETVITGWQDNGTNLRRTGSNDWSEVIGGDGMECAIDPGNGNIMLGELYYGNIRKSTNGGLSFGTIVGSGGASGTVNENGNWVTPYSIAKSTPTTYYVGKTTVYKSTNSGGSFIAASGIPTTGTRVNAIAVSPSNSDYVYAAKGSAMYVTTDGQNFVNRSTGLSGTINYITVHGTNPAIAWVVMSGYSATNKVFKTVNGGQNWTNVTGNMPNVALGCIVTDEQKPHNQLYVGTETGIYYTNDTLAAGWIPFEEGLPNVEVSELEIQYNAGKIVAATYGRGTWVSDLYSATTGGCIASAPLSNFSANLTSVCAGQAVTFTNLTNSCGNNYTWTFPGGTPATSTQLNPTIAYNTPGTYAVTLTTTNAAGNNTKTLPAFIQVKAMVTPTVSISAPKTTICAGESLVFTASPVHPGTAPQYRWFRSGTAILAPLTASSITLNNLVNGEMITCQLNSNADCATNTQTTSQGITVTVNPAVTPTIAISTPRKAICLGENVVIATEVNHPGNAPQYSWYNNGTLIPGASGNSLSLNTLANGNSITAMLTSNAACATLTQPVSNAIVFTVTPVPLKPVITQVGGELISSAPTGNQWFVNNTIIPGANDIMYHPVKNGSYTVQSTVNNCIGPMSDPFSLTIEGISRIFPVPNNGQFILDFYMPEGATSYSLAVFNAIGQLVHKESRSAAPGLVRMFQKLTGMASGTYQVVIIAGGNTYRKRMIIE
jgi:PKD repeat protein